MVFFLKNKILLQSIAFGRHSIAEINKTMAVIISFLAFYLYKENKEWFLYYFTENVPSVLLVLEGGFGTIKQVLSACNQKVPVVVIKDSGRGADVLAYAHENINDDYLKKNGKQHEELMSMIKKNFSDSNLDDTDQKTQSLDGQGISSKELYEDIISCMRERENVSAKCYYFVIDLKTK